MNRLKMAPKLCANLNFLFAENNTNILDRFRLAKKAGFTTVESVIPSDLKLDEVVAVQKETGLKVVLLNITAGTFTGGEVGCASFPDRVSEFKENLKTTVNFAKALNCKKIHITAGKLLESPNEANHETYEKNLKWAVKMLEEEQILGIIEPICSYGVPGYYLNNFERAIQVIKNINSPNLKLMYDLYHVQHLTGNITNGLKELIPYIGHVQVAQVPNRNEPNTEGELNYKYVFKVLEESGYNDWIGCEYKPKTNTLDGLKWIQEFGYSL